MTRFQFEHACQCWLKHWKAYEVYGPEVEANTIDLMSGAVEKVYAVLTNAGIDMLSPHGPRRRRSPWPWIDSHTALTSDNRYSGKQIAEAGWSRYRSGRDFRGFTRATALNRVSLVDLGLVGGSTRSEVLRTLGWSRGHRAPRIFREPSSQIGPGSRAS